MFAPVEKPTPNSSLPESPFKSILIFAPALSPVISDPNTLLISTLSIKSLLKKSKEIFLYSGSSDGSGKPFKEVEL